MGIYIKGMEMPRFSAEYELRLYVDSDGAATVEGAYGCFDGEPFEAVPVPPHGRLINADAIPYNKIMLVNDDFYYGVTKPYIDRMPTIIPADEEEET